MTDRPIIFSGPMVRAILDGRKTQTRRVLKEPSGSGWYRHPATGAIIGCMGNPPPQVSFAPGDRLWVREAFTPTQHGKPVYRADARDQSGFRWHSITPGDPKGEVRWKPSIHMPRWASRLTLTVTGVRIERVQDISEADARAEGVAPVPMSQVLGDPFTEAFRDLWDHLNARRGYGWSANPWVVALTFTAEQRNIDR